MFSTNPKKRFNLQPEEEGLGLSMFSDVLPTEPSLILVGYRGKCDMFRVPLVELQTLSEKHPLHLLHGWSPSGSAKACTSLYLRSISARHFRDRYSPNHGEYRFFRLSKDGSHLLFSKV